MKKFFAIINKAISLGTIIALLQTHLSCKVFAISPAQTKTITIVNPVRSKALWQNPHANSLRDQYELIHAHKFSATWLLQYDTLFDQDIIDTIKTFDNNQEIGLFLEVSQQLASDVGTPYKRDIGDWAWPDKVYLSGYQLSQREDMLDQIYQEFHRQFGFFPKSAGAWHVDAASLEYVHKRYGLTSTIGVADQYDTDANRQWGQYWGFAYYPSRFDALKPAQDMSEKLPVVKIQWAMRDPLLGYGSGPYYSNFSLQANDYSSHQLTTKYFAHILDEYLNINAPLTQATIGLEVGQEGAKYQSEFSRQLAHISALTTAGVNTLTMEKFSSRYQQAYPQLSPPIEITGVHFADNLEPSLKSATALWYMSPNLRIRILSQSNQQFIQDLHVYPKRFLAIDTWVAQTPHRLIRELPATIDHIGINNQSPPLLSIISAITSINKNSRIWEQTLWIGQRYEKTKSSLYRLLSTVAWSKLENAYYFGIKLSPTNLLGFHTPGYFGQMTLDPQTLAHFQHAGLAINKLPTWKSSPQSQWQEAQDRYQSATIQLFDHDTAGSPNFRQWQKDNPGKHRLFSNSVGEIWEK